MTDIKTINAKDLPDDLKAEFERTKKLASKDKYLEGDEDILVEHVTKRVIMVSGKIAGFFSPSKTSMRGQRYWRAGALYILPQFRGQGIMFAVLKEFFKEYHPGVSWIADDNASSIRLFTKLGFKKFKQRDHEGTPGHWYTLN